MSPYSSALLLLALVFLSVGIQKIRPGLIALALVSGLCAAVIR